MKQASAREHRDCSVEWMTVMWSDESPFVFHYKGAMRIGDSKTNAIILNAWWGLLSTIRKSCVGWWVFQHDNYPKHQAPAKSVQRWLHRTTNWCSGLPKVLTQPYWNLWSIIDRKLSERMCNSEEELFDVLKSTWETLTPEMFAKLVSSIPNRCEAVIRSRGPILLKNEINLLLTILFKLHMWTVLHTVCQKKKAHPLFFGFFWKKT